MNPLKFILSDRAYETLKWVIVAVLPAVSLLYGGLAEVWGWPNVAAVLTTIAAITAFLSAVFGITTYAFNQAHTVVVKDRQVPVDPLPTPETLEEAYQPDTSGTPPSDS